MAGLAMETRGTGKSLTGKARLRTAICAYSFREALKSKRMTYDDLVKLAVDLDVDGLDLTVYWFPSTSDDFLIPLRRLAYRNAVEIYSISVRTDLCRPTPELQSQEYAGICKWVDVALKLGAGHIRVFGGEVPKGNDPDQAAQWVIAILKRAGEYAGQKGIILGLENHGGITLKADRIVEIVKAVGSSSVGINLDTGNFESDTYAQIEACVPYAVNVQFKTEIKEGGKKLPSDWNRIMGLLAKGNYKGYLALEYEAEENPETAVPKLTRQLNRIARQYSGSLKIAKT
jgi:sugar phosphate isomerase/epimerase